MRGYLILALAAVVVLPATPASAAFPGRNARIAFVRYTTGDIYSMTASGAKLQQLTNTPQLVEHDPAWSPDGKRIAYRVSGGGPDELRVMNADGTGQTVVPGSGVARLPSWSPDGKRLVYECHETQPPYAAHICVREVTGGGFQLLTASPGVDDWYPVWSPDGTRIVFSRKHATGMHLLVLTIKGLSLDQLTLPAAGVSDTWPDWSPDSTQIVFSRAGAIHRIPANGSGAVTLVTGPPPAGSTDTMPVWSPDGKRILYSQYADNGTWAYLFTVDPDGNGTVQLTSGSTDIYPDWGTA